MIGIIIPAHNEASLLPACLHSIHRARQHPDLRGETSLVVVAAEAVDLDHIRGDLAEVIPQHLLDAAEPPFHS